MAKLGRYVWKTRQYGGFGAVIDPADAYCHPAGDNPSKSVNYPVTEKYVRIGTFWVSC
jgi:hypothetical protein